eukprot:394058-Rhodomonas_salina.3
MGFRDKVTSWLGGQMMGLQVSSRTTTMRSESLKCKTHARRRTRDRRDAPSRALHDLPVPAWDTMRACQALSRIRFRLRHHEDIPAADCHGPTNLCYVTHDPVLTSALLVPWQVARYAFKKPIGGYGPVSADAACHRRCPVLTYTHILDRH